MPGKVRVLLVEFEADDSEAGGAGTMTLARALRDSGIEVVYTTAATTRAAAVAAVQEDVRAVGVVVNGERARRACAGLAAEVPGIVVFATAADPARDLLESGVAAVFPPDGVGSVTTWATKLA